MKRSRASPCMLHRRSSEVFEGLIILQVHYSLGIGTEKIQSTRSNSHLEVQNEAQVRNFITTNQIQLDQNTEGWRNIDDGTGGQDRTDCNPIDEKRLCESAYPRSIHMCQHETGHLLRYTTYRTHKRRDSKERVYRIRESSKIPLKQF